MIFFLHGIKIHIFLALGYIRKRRLRKKGKVRIALKAHKPRRGRSGRKKGVKYRKRYLLEEMIKEDKESKKKDPEQLSKRKKTPTGALEHHVEKKEE